MDRQFRDYLASLGHVPSKVTVCRCYAGEKPDVEASIWIVSGQPSQSEVGTGHHDQLLDHIRRVGIAGQPVYGLNYGERVLEAALCKRRDRHDRWQSPRSVRNPFRSFWMRDVLYSVVDEVLVGAPRPRGIPSETAA